MANRSELQPLRASQLSLASRAVLKCCLLRNEETLKVRGTYYSNSDSKEVQHPSTRLVQGQAMDPAGRISALSRRGWLDVVPTLFDRFLGSHPFKFTCTEIQDSLTLKYSKRPKGRAIREPKLRFEMSNTQCLIN